MAFGDSEPPNFSWLIKRLVFRLQKLETGLKDIQNQAFKVNIKPPKSILGVDLLDVAFFEEMTSVRAQEVHQTWTHLTDNDPMVFFGRKLYVQLF
jgi:hypothetical protein